MQRILAIVGLTWKAAFRFRLFLVIAVLLLASVIGLPLVLKSDGTARGFTQILMTYTLTVISALLGFCTLWLACGTLARDVEECQMQVVATKPVARWQIWLGKWLGIVSLNAALLALSGGCVYALVQWRATRLPPAQQKILHEDLLVARGAIKPSDYQAEIEAQTDQTLQQRLKQIRVKRAEIPMIRHQIHQEVLAQYQVVPPQYSREWQIHLGSAKHVLHDQPLYLRIKFHAANKSPSGTFTGIWVVGDPQKTRVWQSQPMSLAPDTYHEIRIPANLYDQRGVLTINFLNANNTALLFPLQDGMEVLYPESGFTMNFARGLAIILCWMGLLAALGLTAASFLSFPVAAFFSLATLTVVLMSGTMTEAVANAKLTNPNQGPGLHWHAVSDLLLIPLFKGLLAVISLAKNFSPIDALSTGRMIPWSELGRAFLQIVVLLGGAIGLLGIWLFSRRELATAQGNQ